MRAVLASRIMPRTTLDIDAAVLAELRERAEAEGKSMGQVGSELLAAELKRDRAEGITAAPRFEWKTYSMGEPLIDIDDKDALYAVLDADD